LGSRTVQLKGEIMSKTPPRSRSCTARLPWRGLACVALLLAGRALAQQPDEPAPIVPADFPKLYYSHDPKDPNPAALGVVPISLRPGVEQNIYLFLKNPSPDPVRNVTVTLRKVVGPKETVAIETAEVPLLEPDNKTVLLKFGKKPGPSLVKGKLPEAPWAALEGPPFLFELWVEKPAFKTDKNQKPLVNKQPLAFKIMPPAQYLDLSRASFNPVTREFEVKVVAKKNFFGPKAEIQLVLSPELIPGLLPIKTGGAYRQIVTKPDDEVKLIAKNIQFKGGLPPPQGRIYVNVDGYERAAIYQISFTAGKTQAMSSDKPRARILAPRFAVPGDKCLAIVQVDFAPDDCFVNFGFDRAGNRTFPDAENLPGFRRQLVYFLPEGAKGGLDFLPLVTDWVREVDTADVFGLHAVQAQLLERGGTGAPGKVIDLVDETAEKTPGGEPLPLFTNLLVSPFAPLTYTKNAVQATIMLDGTKPEGLKFVDWPTGLELVRGSPLLLRARGWDPESHIAKVTFFLGEPVDDKLPPKAITSPGVLLNPNAPETKMVWEGELPIPTDKPGKFEVSVQFTNGAGLSTTETVIIKLVDAPKKGAKYEGTTITGTIHQGDLLIPDVGVNLVDEKGVIRATTVSKDKGLYKFTGVIPGTYRIVAVRPAANTQGQAVVTIPEGLERKDDVDILLSR
jgi:hypothetical protein